MTGCPAFIPELDTTEEKHGHGVFIKIPFRPCSDVPMALPCPWWGSVRTVLRVLCWGPGISGGDYTAQVSVAPRRRERSQKGGIRRVLFEFKVQWLGLRPSPA